MFVLQSLFSTTAFGLGGKYFAFYEEEGVGVQWSNIYISPVENDQYNLLMILMMMIFDAFLYGILAWYIGNVFPGRQATGWGREVGVKMFGLNWAMGEVGLHLKLFFLSYRSKHKLKRKEIKLS